MKKSINSLSFIILLSLLPVTISSQDLESKKLEFSICGGYLLPGKGKASYHADFNPDSTVTIKNTTSPLLKIYVDFNLNQNFP